MLKELVISDLDGCLWDAKKKRDEFYFHICHKHGKPCPGRVAHELSDGVPRDMGDEYNRLGFDWKNDKELIWDEFIEFFNSSPPDIFRETLNALYQLRRDGVKTALITKNSWKVVSPLIERENLEDLFHIIKTKEDGKGSSKSLLFRKCLEQLDIPPSQAVSFGDHIYDIDAAEETGILPVAVGYGGFVKPDILLERVPETQFALKPKDVYRVLRNNLNHS